MVVTPGSKARSVARDAEVGNNDPESQSVAKKHGSDRLIFNRHTGLGEGNPRRLIELKKKSR